MASYNRVVLYGNITMDPEMRTSSNGIAITTMSMAINEKWKDKETVSFIDLTAFGRTAEIAAEYVEKGSPVLVEGKLKQDRWESEDGQKRSKVHVIVDRLVLMPRGSGSSKVEAAPPSDDDVPF